MRIGWLATMIGTGCAVGTDPAEIPEIPASDPSSGCRGWCESTTATWPVEAYTVDLSFVLDTEGRPAEVREGTFHGVVTAADLSDDPPLAVVALDIALNDHWPALGLGSVEVFGPTRFRLTGFFDVDGDADPNDPQPSDGDPVTMPEFDVHRAREGYADATVYLAFVD